MTRFFERKLPRHLSVSGTLLGCPLAPRGLLSPPLFPHKIAVCTAEWKITGFVLHRGRRRDVDVGGREGGSAEGGEDWHPTSIPPAFMLLAGESGDSSSASPAGMGFPGPHLALAPQEGDRGGDGVLAGCSVHKCQRWSPPAPWEMKAFRTFDGHRAHSKERCVKNHRLC